MSPTLRIVLIAAMLFYFIILIGFVRRRGLNLKYFLLWLGMGLVLLVLILFPGLLTVLASLLGIQLEMNGLISAICFFLIILDISLTAILSHQNDKITRLLQKTALLEKRIDELEKAQGKEETV